MEQRAERRQLAFPRWMYRTLLAAAVLRVGKSNSTNNQWELTNTTSFVEGAHSLKVGGRLRFG